MEKAKKEGSRFSIVHGEAMIDAVADVYDKTTNGSAQQGRKAMNKRAGKKEAEDANAEETMLSQCIMAIYKVNAAGGMRRFAEVDVDMGRRFFSSQDGNMTLTRSYDKKLISLANFEQAHANKEYFKIKAWTTKLGAFECTYDQLNKGINEYFANNVFIDNDESQNKRSFDSLVSVTFANRSKIIEIVYHERAERDDKEQQDYLADVKEKYKMCDEKDIDESVDIFEQLGVNN